VTPIVATGLCLAVASHSRTEFFGEIAEEAVGFLRRREQFDEPCRRARRLNRRSG
jgi:hypothetical protein